MAGGGDWDAWNARSSKDEPIIRLILDGTVVRVRLDKKATSISLLVALGVRQDGQKVLLAAKTMGGESEAAWRALLDDLVERGLAAPELGVIGRPSALCAVGTLQSRSQRRAEDPEVDQLFQPSRRVAEFRQLAIPLVQIEKSRLPNHHDSPAPQTQLNHDAA